MVAGLWAEQSRRQASRRALWHEPILNLGHGNWAVVRPLSRRTSRVGRPRNRKARTLWDAIQYIAATGCPWAQLPKDFPPFTTVQDHFYGMRDNGLLDAVNAVLVTGRKRHIVINMLEGVVHAAGIQDRDGAPGRIERSCDTHPAIIRLLADGGYAGQKLRAAVAHIDRLTIEIIRRSDLTGFVVLPRRWIVERTMAWLNRCRRLAKDWEASIALSEAWMIVSSIRRMTRRIVKLE
ncbi:transposase [Sphingomonas mollis]|uniref:Transposase n=1 Tax=Sphingomonas mollis TaxID=2795726 RepID=A0ABS0XUL3_9SPHN|nr:transposase [Sphingomonas sp. BT553]